MKNAVSWDVTPCDPRKNRRSKGTYHFHFQDDKIDELGTALAVTSKRSTQRSSETSVITVATWHKFPDDGILQNIYRLHNCVYMLSKRAC
jgi:hypothetical protein